MWAESKRDHRRSALMRTPTLMRPLIDQCPQEGNLRLGRPLGQPQMGDDEASRWSPVHTRDLVTEKKVHAGNWVRGCRPRWSASSGGGKPGHGPNRQQQPEKLPEAYQRSKSTGRRKCSDDGHWQVPKCPTAVSIVARNVSLDCEFRVAVAGFARIQSAFASHRNLRTARLQLPVGRNVGIRARCLWATDPIVIMASHHAAIRDARVSP